MERPPFAGLSRSLADVGTLRAYPKRTIVFQEGDPGDQLYVVVEGRVKVFLADADGREIVLDMLGPGQYFGEMALDGQPRSASVMTVEPSKLASVTREAFRNVLATNPDASIELVVTVIRRARNLTRVAGNLALLDVYGRIARLLLDEAQDRDGQRVVTQRLSHREIAARVGASREMVSRVFADLRDGGFIAESEAGIVILQPLPDRR
jgi:CRP/FNR family cyclic AMP-dependent transcriptional regulator